MVGFGRFPRIVKRNCCDLNIAGCLRITYCLVMSIHRESPHHERAFPLRLGFKQSFVPSISVPFIPKPFLQGAPLHEYRSSTNQGMWWVFENDQGMGKNSWLNHQTSLPPELRNAYWLGAPNGSRRRRTRKSSTFQIICVQHL